MSGMTNAARSLTLSVLPDLFAICKLPADTPAPPLPDGDSLVAMTRTADGLSLVLPESRAPHGARSERGWRCLKVSGPIDFDLTGVLESIAAPLAVAGVSIFALSTYDTDYVLVRDGVLDRAREALEAAGHRFVEVT